MISCTRRIHFDAAHRVMEHKSKCHKLHGHRYVIDATFSAKELDELGMIIDFGIIKEILGAWIDENWDHNTILNQKDKKLGEAIAQLTNQKIYYLDANPTAEKMAEYVKNEVCPKLFANHPVKCVRIKIYETPNCYAET